MSKENLVKHDLVEDKSLVLTPIKTQNTSTKKSSTKKLHALDVYIVFCFVCIIIYTAIHTIIFYQTGIEAKVLDALFYGVFGGEVLLCALLKRLKLRHEFQLKQNQQKQQEEEDYTDTVELSENRYDL